MATPSSFLQAALAAVRAAPKDARAWLHLGNVLAQEGDKQKAKECYERALALDPLLSEAHQGLDALSQPSAPALPAFLQGMETPVEPPSVTIEHPAQPPRLTAKRSLLTDRRAPSEPEPQPALPPPPPADAPSAPNPALSALAALFRGLQRLISWWWGKIRNAPSTGVAVSWVFLTLCGICFSCSALYSVTPMGQADAAQRRATRTAVAVAEVTAEAIAAVTRSAEEQAEATAEAGRQQEQATAQVIAQATAAEATRIAPTSTATPEPTGTPGTPLVTVVNAQLNARSGPGTAYQVLTTLKQGDVLPALGISPDRGWVQVVLPDGQKGWVSSGAEFATVSFSEMLETSTDFAALPTQPPASTGGGTSGGSSGGSSGCDPSYPDFCLPPSRSNTLNCPDIPYNDFRVFQPDPHDFDRNKDGIGCESN